MTRHIRMPLRRQPYLPCLALAALLSLGVSAGWVGAATSQAVPTDDEPLQLNRFPDPAGTIVDRQGRALISHTPSYTLMLLRREAPDLDALLHELANVLGADEAGLRQRLHEARHLAMERPVPLVDDLPVAALAVLREHAPALPGLRVQVAPIQAFGFGDLAGHLFARPRSGSDQPGGGLLYRLDQVPVPEALPGRRLTLTLDAPLQQTAEAALGEAGEGNLTGAVVAMAVDSGRVLVAASAPGIPLTDLNRGIAPESWRALHDDKRAPLRNRVVMTAYPPGSLFKLVTGLASLSAGVITPDTVFDCPGSVTHGARRFNCWLGRGHGEITLDRAIAEGCAVFFYRAGLAAGPEALARAARALGLGALTGIETWGESPGRVPDPAWLHEARQMAWEDQQTLISAIGQGFVSATPVQLCQLTATLANGGTRFAPRLIESVRERDGKVLASLQPQGALALPGAAEHLRLLRQAMRRAVEDPRGTARAVAIPGLAIAASSGTAQVTRLAAHKGLPAAEIPERFRDHAWFTCFAPADRPEIAVTVLLEHGGHGSAAAPVARRILEAYFAAHPAAGARE